MLFFLRRRWIICVWIFLKALKFTLCYPGEPNVYHMCADSDWISCKTSSFSQLWMNGWTGQSSSHSACNTQHRQCFIQCFAMLNSCTEKKVEKKIIISTEVSRVLNSKHVRPAFLTLSPGTAKCCCAFSCENQILLCFTTESAISLQIKIECNKKNL